MTTRKKTLAASVFASNSSRPQKRPAESMHQGDEEPSNVAAARQVASGAPCKLDGRVVKFSLTLM
jgi:hypothetical protein